MPTSAPDSSSLLDRLLLRWFRRNHGRIVGHRSSEPGYAGMIEEVRALVDHDDAASIDGKVRSALRAFITRPVTRLVHRLARRWPQRADATFFGSTPLFFRWLVGPIDRTGDRELTVRDCRFLADGGPSACRHACQVPTEGFFSDELAIPLRLTPDLERGTCAIHIDRDPR